MSTLSDLPRRLPRPGLLSVHGAGRGGGEVVADKIRAVYAGQGWPVPVLASTGALRARWTAIAAMPPGQPALLTAGPRDLPLLLACAWLRRPCAVYLQVPYWRALTWRDPLHAAGVLAYLAAVALVARPVLVNAAATAVGLWGRRADVVWPITDAERDAPGDAHPVTADGDGMPEPATIDVVCRLAVERGRGARDLEALERLLAECRERRDGRRTGPSVRHFGDCAPLLRRRLERAGGEAVSFLGHRTDWVRAGRGPVVLVSRYEGFGLAAFEAARAGRQVYVSEAFPDDLMRLCPTIRRLRTATGEALLPQLGVGT